MFPEVGKRQGNIHRKHNFSATMFPGLPRALLTEFCYKICLMIVREERDTLSSKLLRYK